MLLGSYPQGQLPLGSVFTSSSGPPPFAQGIYSTELPPNRPKFDERLNFNSAPLSQAQPAQEQGAYSTDLPPKPRTSINEATDFFSGPVVANFQPPTQPGTFLFDLPTARSVSLNERYDFFSAPVGPQQPVQQPGVYSTDLPVNRQSFNERLNLSFTMSVNPAINAQPGTFFFELPTARLTSINENYDFFTGPVGPNGPNLAVTQFQHRPIIRIHRRR